MPKFQYDHIPIATEQGSPWNSLLVKYSRVQKRIENFVGYLVQTMTQKEHSEIN